MSIEEQARSALSDLASQHGLDVAGGKICRTSSRFCLGVEHGDYNGTELFGVGTGERAAALRARLGRPPLPSLPLRRACRSFSRRGSVAHGGHSAHVQDRFIWIAYKPNGTKSIRIVSHNFPKDGLVEFEIGSVRQMRR